MTTREVARLRCEVREREVRLRQLEARLNAVETSVAWQIGRLLAAVARQPVPGVVRLPRQLYRLWRQRRVGVETTTLQRESAAGTLSWSRLEDRLLLRRPGVSDDRPVVIGVLSRATATVLAKDAHVVPLLPHDAVPVLEQADADLVIVDTAAAAPGGPWAYLGEPGLLDRERAVRALLDSARAARCPVVLWSPGGVVPPGLSRFEWDAIESGDPADVATWLARLMS